MKLGEKEKDKEETMKAGEEEIMKEEEEEKEVREEEMEEEASKESDTQVEDFGVAETDNQEPSETKVITGKNDDGNMKEDNEEENFVDDEDLKVEDKGEDAQDKAHDDSDMTDSNDDAYDMDCDAALKALVTPQDCSLKQETGNDVPLVMSGPMGICRGVVLSHCFIYHVIPSVKDLTV